MTRQVNHRNAHQTFIAFLTGFMEVSDELEQKILAVSDSFSAPKGTHLVKEGEVNEYCYFLLSGAAHIYFTKGRKRVTTWISLDQDFLTILANTMNGQNPSKENLELLEDSDLLRFKRSDIEALYDCSKEFERLGRKMTGHYFGIMNNKLHGSYFLTAKQRYDDLIDRHPEAIIRVPLGIIASYLGISQETLSRIRNPKYGR